MISHIRAYNLYFYRSLKDHRTISMVFKNGKLGQISLEKPVPLNGNWSNIENAWSVKNEILSSTFWMYCFLLKKKLQFLSYAMYDTKINNWDHFQADTKMGMHCRDHPALVKQVHSRSVFFNFQLCVIRSSPPVNGLKDP